MKPYVSVFNVGDVVRVLGAIRHVVVHLSINRLGLPEVLVRNLEKRRRDVFYVMDDDADLVDVNKMVNLDGRRAR